MMRSLLFALVFGLSNSVHAAPVVSTQSLADLVYYPTFSAPAEVISANDAALSAELSARIVKINVEVGDRVKQGDALVNLDCRTYESQLATQKAVLSELRSQRPLLSDQYERAKTLNKRGNLGDDALQQRETALTSLDARIDVQNRQIELAGIATENCSLVAPFDGVIAARMAQLGALAAPGMPLLQLVQTDGAELEAKVAPGKGVAESKVWFESNGQSFAVELRAKLPIIDRRERTQTYRFIFTEATPEIGATGRLNWTANQPHVSSELLVRRKVDGEWKLGLLLEEQGVAQFVVVDGAIEGQPAAVDLPKGSQVITEGRLLAVEGEAVEVR
ncbi:efflux RND transporter periplasmic adaptor subunit [Marinobacterium sp. xm-d-564]|uniref:efflux RND transporter periplasmic adaptor subunit n=1 Tax=Marinobacterium sp. xm-d-564 TaxID=2497742 RepID=UPI0015688E4A|nr:HlyD family efflux transporter periplasmic adaptor subunit [Marinobacterium sp. xm-d-564]